MFHIATDVRAVQAEGIVAISPFDMMHLRQRLSQIAADEVFVAQFSAKGRSPCCPVEIAAEAHPIHIRAVIVELHLLRPTAITLIAVTILVPVDVAAHV